MMLDDRSMFVVLAEAGSFARASRQLGVARSTVMRRLDALEQELGITLVQRAGRRIVLTDAGRRYAEALRPALDALARAEQRALGEHGRLSGPFRVWLPILGTPSFIVPALAEFQKAYPDVVVHMEMGRDTRQLELGAFDVALQTSHRINPSLASRTVWRERLILIASAAYLDARGVPTCAADLASHRAVHERDVEGKLSVWRRPDGERVAMPPPSVVVNSVGFAVELARLDVGITRAPATLVAPDLEAGTLRHILPEIWTEAPISFVFLPDPPPTTRAFLDFVVARARAGGRYPEER